MTSDARRDIKATWTSTNHPPLSYTDVSPNLPPSLLMGKFRGEKQSPSIARCYPSSPNARAFLLFRVWLQTFLPASSKSNNRPSVPWEHRGGRDWRERGIRHTARTRGQSVGKENAQGGTERRRERRQGACIWKVFSALRRGPSHCKSDGEEKA